MPFSIYGGESSPVRSGPVQVLVRASRLECCSDLQFSGVVLAWGSSVLLNANSAGLMNI